MMEKHERLQQQIAFLMEIDKVKNIFRQTYLADGERKENDAEHSWHIALMAVLLQEHAEEEVDLLKVMTMMLHLDDGSCLPELFWCFPGHHPSGNIHMDAGMQ